MHDMQQTAQDVERGEQYRRGAQYNVNGCVAWRTNTVESRKSTVDSRSGEEKRQADVVGGFADGRSGDKALRKRERVRVREPVRFTSPGHVDYTRERPPNTIVSRWPQAFWRREMWPAADFVARSPKLRIMRRIVTAVHSG
jgi:hypothetical protein